MVNFFKDNKYLLLMSFIYVIFNVFLFFSFDNWLAIWLIWNLFLGLLPLFFINVFKNLYETNKSTLLCLVFFLLWLLFFPNSIYIITDFIHLQSNVFYEHIKINNGYGVFSNYQTIYTKDISIWLKLLSISLSYVLSTLAAIKSLDMVMDFLKKRFNSIVSYIFLLIISLLTGIAIYIGRFLRFNSWDVFNVFKIIKTLVADFSIFQIQFILSFSAYTLFIYILYKSIRLDNKSHLKF